VHRALLGSVVLRYDTSTTMSCVYYCYCYYYYYYYYYDDQHDYTLRRLPCDTDWFYKMREDYNLACLFVNV
jgi:hypothetical protein